MLYIPAYGAVKAPNKPYSISVGADLKMLIAAFSFKSRNR